MEIINLILIVILIAGFCWAVYELGKSNGSDEVLLNKSESIKNTLKQYAKIAADKNLDRDELLDRMRKGKL